ncbi:MULTISPECIES: rubredoxin [Dehalococcoides]|jgi:rubredoxin|uniref:Rub n=2 Tax=environmental samples TaxID=171951 RepID=F8V4B7_9CHLR|nr:MULTISPECIES: rubredoxin [Dehalococcoides]AEI59444.1 Rub [Dehalococcoides sp. enrichment culture clone PM_Dhc_01]AEI59450.1 Rub [Dehalococcoides sp. enrichment culture clone EV_Dhc_01]AGG08469.1 rubredoxin domain-containing protein [Dehalococcoides mccartyi BTF08]AQX75158.1 rubredoxin [Dehalococcoides mccartyi]QYY57577.1 rubredoxin [Dehalococcoides mccartyi]
MERRNHRDEKIVQFVINCANRKPKPIRRAIALEVEKEFGVTISERTIGRYCNKANESTDIDQTVSSNVDICKASPEGLDTLMLIKWGVPKEAAPDILGDWRKHHERGEHEICNAYGKLKRNLMDREIPYEQANALLEYEKGAIEFDDSETHTSIEIIEALRPWEDSKNTKLAFKEIRRKNKSTWEDMENSYECGFCEKCYSPMSGDPSHGIEPNTPFEDLPESWTCPACGRRKEQFKKMGE